MSRWVRAEGLYLVAVFAALLGALRTKAFNDPGALWHIRVGELILTDGFPRTDPFTYPFAGQPWTPQQWAAEVLMAVAHRIAGLDGLLIGLSLPVAGLFALQFSQLRRAGMAVPLSAAVGGACLFVGGFHYYARPHMATVVGMGLLTAWLVDVDRGRRGVRSLFWLPPLFVAWANLHGGMLGGLLTLGLVAGGWFLSGRRPRRALVAAVAGCGLAPLVNPFGVDMLRTWFAIVGSDVLKQAVSEHMPLRLTEAGDRLMLLLFVGYAVLLAGARGWRWTWLVPAVWFALTVASIRHGPLFAVTVAFVVPDVWPHTRWKALLAEHGDSLVAPAPPPVPAAAWVIPAACVVLLAAAAVRVGWAGLDPAEVPVAFAPQVQEFAARPDGRRLYNDANFGGFVVHHAPTLRIFMDDRFEQYGEAWARQYVEAIWQKPERFDAWDARWRFGLALVATGPSRTPLDDFLGRHPDWREVGRLDYAALYRKRTR